MQEPEALSFLDKLSREELVSLAQNMADETREILDKIYVDADLLTNQDFLDKFRKILRKDFAVIERARTTNNHSAFYALKETYVEANGFYHQITEADPRIARIKGDIKKYSSAYTHEVNQYRDTIKEKFDQVRLGIRQLNLDPHKEEELIQEAQKAEYLTRKNLAISLIEDAESSIGDPNAVYSVFKSTVEPGFLSPMKNLAMDLANFPEYQDDCEQFGQWLQDCIVLHGSKCEIVPSVIGTLVEDGGKKVYMRSFPGDGNLAYSQDVDSGLMNRVMGGYGNGSVGARKYPTLGKPISVNYRDVTTPGAPWKKEDVQQTLSTFIAKTLYYIFSSKPLRFNYFDGTKVKVFDTGAPNAINGGNVHLHMDRLVKIIWGRVLYEFPEEGEAITKGDVSRLINYNITLGLFPSVFTPTTTPTLLKDSLRLWFDSTEKRQARNMGGKNRGPFQLHNSIEDMEEVSPLPGLFDFHERSIKFFIESLKQNGLLNKVAKPEVGNKITVQVPIGDTVQDREVDQYEINESTYGPAAFLFQSVIGLEDRLSAILPIDYYPQLDSEHNTLMAARNIIGCKVPLCYEGPWPVGALDRVDENGIPVFELNKPPRPPDQPSFGDGLSSDTAIDFNLSHYYRNIFNLRRGVETSLFDADNATLANYILKPTFETWSRISSEIGYFVETLPGIAWLKHIPPYVFIPPNEIRRISNISDREVKRAEIERANKNGEIIRKRVLLEIKNRILVQTTLHALHTVISSGEIWSNVNMAMDCINKLFRENPQLFGELERHPYPESEGEMSFSGHIRDAVTKGFRGETRNSPVSYNDPYQGTVRGKIFGTYMFPDMRREDIKKILELYVKARFREGVGVISGFEGLKKSMGSLYEYH